MAQDKTSMYLLIIVGIVAAVGILVLLLSGSADNTISGQALTAKKIVSYTKTDTTDTDGDGLTDKEETSGAYDGYYPSNPYDKDSDDDQISDYWEVSGEEYKSYTGTITITDPEDADTDDDKFSDYVEFSFETDPTNRAEYSSCSEWDESSSYNDYFNEKDSTYIDLYTQEQMKYIKNANVPGGKDSVFGEFVYTNEKCVSAATYCYSSSNNAEPCGKEILLEYYCGGSAYARYYNCPSGYKCNDGACVKK